MMHKSILVTEWNRHQLSLRSMPIHPSIRKDHHRVLVHDVMIITFHWLSFDFFRGAETAIQFGFEAKHQKRKNNDDKNRGRARRELTQ